jgi:fermentation-respiration switch protein FrsA (DUF1100 family)
MRRLGVIAVLIAAAVFGARLFAIHLLEQHMIHVHPQGQRTPRTRGLVYDEIAIDSGGRKLRSFYVPADGPGLLIFHGNGESISGWVEALKVLHDAGIAAMVFDYSGFGNSPGAPTLAHFHDDGIAAWRAFRERLPAATRACAYGLSLGSAVLLEVAADLSPAPDCIAVSGAFLSVRAAAVRMKGLELWQSYLLPDVLDSLENIARVRGPVLIEHGTEDELFPVAWAQRLAAAHPGAQLEIVKGMHHADPVAHPSGVSWDPVIRFVKGEKPAPKP